MASTREKFTKDGRRFFEIIVSRGRGVSQVTERWYPQDTWSKRTIEKELSKAAAEFERKVKAGEYCTRAERKEQEEIARAEAAKIRTLKQYFEGVYLPALKVRASKHTIDCFEQNFNLHIMPRIGDMKLPDITTADLSAVLLAAQTKLKIASVTKIYTILNLVFKKAYIEDDAIPQNPMDKVAKPKARKDESRTDGVEAFTEDEVNRIMAMIDTEPLMWKAYIKVLIYTGCRRGEACGLQWKDIDFDNSTIYFRRSLAYSPKAGIYQDTLKNRQNRKLYLDPSVSDTMELLKAIKKQNKVVSIKGDDYVFTQSADTALPMHPDTPTRYFKKLGVKYGIENFHPHKLRHTYASIAERNGADMVSLSANMGHATPEITYRVYSHPSEESRKNASNAFGNALKQKLASGQE